MSTVPELEGWALARAAAERLGWQAIHSQTYTGGVDHLGRKPGSVFTDRVPAYHASFDACERDLLPGLREAGWDSLELWNGWDEEAGTWFCRLRQGRAGGDEIGRGTCAAEAAARAFLRAMSEEKQGG